VKKRVAKIVSRAARAPTTLATLAHKNAGAIALGWLLACAAGYDVKAVAARYLGIPVALASCCGVGEPKEKVSR
jgi:D-aminopeptidase